MPLPVADADGNIVGYRIYDKSGNVKDLDPGGDRRFASPFDKAFLANKGKEEGEFAGTAANAAVGDIAAAESALAVIGEIKNHPYKSRGTGFTSNFNGVAGTGGMDFQNVVKQAKSQAFLVAIEQLRGMGALSNAEGETATAAANRLNTATSEGQFDQDLAVYESIVRQGLERSKANLSKRGSQTIPKPKLTKPPQAAIEFLLKNNSPDMVRKFDEKYGVGSAQQLLDGGM
jgi:hypothetical protein